ncbi:alpha/beta-hydrolase [Hymenopellis radicata]|nr:alpha/beta-hydrolase [Hymenopellis radicata]
MEHFDIFSNIPYAESPVPNPLLEFDLYVPHSGSTAQLRPLICFVHGGAWRSEDKSDHAVLAQKLGASTGFAVIVANYRLTPQAPTAENQLVHPAHAEDVLQLLSFITAWEGPRGGIYLMGHSCGAHMLAVILLNSSRVTPSLTPSPHILLSVRGAILSAGIYDIDALLSRFPSYRMWFIENAFGDHDSYEQFSVTSLPARNTSIRWLIAHSTDDELVDLPQSETMFRHLRQLYANIPHVDTLVTKTVGSYGQHNEMLEAEDYIDVVANFVKGGGRSSTM